MSTRCLYRLPDGNFCRRWASPGSRFCAHHQGSTAQLPAGEGAELHPLARLTTPADLFDLIRKPSTLLAWAASPRPGRAS